MAKKDETKVEEVVDVKETEETTAVTTAEEPKEGFFKRNANKLKAGAIVLLAFATGVAAGDARFNRQMKKLAKSENTEPEEEETEETAE